MGVTEFNPNLVASPEAKEVPEPWNAVRDKLGAIKPAYFRLVIDWASIQPSAEGPASMDQPQGGCMRAVGPCLGWGGVREQLRALASRQREGGWTTLVVFTSTPDWAASPPSGCERPQAVPRARPPRADALPAYRALVEQVLATAREEGAALTYFSPWNEPNHPAFISPQRPACDPAVPSTAPAAYAQIATTLQQALEAAPGDQQLVLGETAGLMKSTRYVTSVPDFIAGLPKELVCATTVWSQHAYIGGDDPVEQADAALAAHALRPPVHVLDHRDWRRPGAQGPQRGRLDLRRRRGLPRSARPARPLVGGPARDDRLPVHGPRGRQVPHRAGQHRPHDRPPRAEGMDRVGRRAVKPTAPPPASTCA